MTRTSPGRVAARAFIATGAPGDLPPPFRSIAPHLGDRRSAGDAELVHARDESWILATTKLDGAGDLSDAAFRAASADLVETIVTAMRGACAHSIVRMWSFVPGISDPSVDGDRYRSFNAGRAEAFAALAPRLAHLPAASGVGHAGRALVVHALALRGRSRAVENPRQTPAWRYSPRYGVRPPLFARACVVDDGDARAIFVSGTASVVGEESRHPDDFMAQVEETLANLDALGTAVDRACGAPARLPLEAMRIHVRPVDADRATEARDRVAARHRSALIEVVVAPLCRAELAVEVEGCAWRPNE